MEGNESGIVYTLHTQFSTQLILESIVFNVEQKKASQEFPILNHSNEQGKGLVCYLPCAVLQ